MHACSFPTRRRQPMLLSFALKKKKFFFNSDNFPGFYSAEFLKCALFFQSWISRGNFQNDSGGITFLTCFFPETRLPPFELNVTSFSHDRGWQEGTPGLFHNKIIGNLLLTTCSLSSGQVPGFRCLNWTRHDFS